MVLVWLSFGYLFCSKPLTFGVSSSVGHMMARKFGALEFSDFGCEASGF